ncbi:dapper homolog 2 isoform X1 [Mustela nigripes]|uniref:dapper homolog 2 isoform X1 n=1 Tax=Mustela nigripes TaxID=77151 RepID=UPI00281549EC|nr:dapper homolog 2 isoform X1 [Mustela nigripes]
MWAPSCPPGPAGWDRRRVGARLRAALAGLRELQGLRATQQARVRGALAMQSPPGPAAPEDPARPEHPRGPRAQELRLEAALAALQEQLNRLRRQDVGLKTHLEQLDRQIGELQLDGSGPCGRAADGDSRPSSGFYELSDGGSCSLSASRTSVCSDRVYSSRDTLLPANPTARPDAGDGRPRSADETTVHGAPLPAWRPLATEEGVSRPRPVSTGDLERVLPSELELQKASAHPKSTSVLCPGMDLPAPVLDPKYQCDLVSKGGREVYPYPSPLHAVALQSPLFALHKEALPSPGHSPPREPLPSPAALGSIQTRPVLEAGPAAAYIDRLLRLHGRGIPLRGSVGEQGPPRHEGPLSPPMLGGQRAEREGGLDRLVCTPERAGMGRMPRSGDTGRDSLEQGPERLTATPHPRSLPEEGPEPQNGCVRGETTRGSPPLGHGPALSPCLQALQPALSCQDGTVRWPTRKGGRESPALAPGLCAQPPFADHGAFLLGLNTGHPKTKAVKVKRGATDKVQPSPGRALAAPLLPPEWGQGLGRRPVPAGAAPSRSCSEPRLYPVPLLVPLLVTRREGRRAPVQALFPLEVAAGVQVRKQQRRWLSSVEVAGGLGPPRPAVSRARGPQPGCARARPRLPRQDARVRSESEGSEPSAKGVSLLYSTVAETSEDGASDHTSSRFGDRESSSSDSEVGAWPRACPPQPSRAPGARRPPLPPMPKLCRIKASKALRRKIRRFQPAALRVMTMV